MREQASPANSYQVAHVNAGQVSEADFVLKD